jgi:hypothetical protein
MDIYIVGSIFLLIVALMGFLLYRYIQSLERTVHKVIEDFQEVHNVLQNRQDRNLNIDNHSNSHPQQQSHPQMVNNIQKPVATNAEEGGAMLESNIEEQQNDFENELLSHSQLNNNRYRIELSGEINTDEVNNDVNNENEENQDNDNTDNDDDAEDDVDNDGSTIDLNNVNEDDKENNKTNEFFPPLNREDTEDDGLDDMQDYQNISPETSPQVNNDIREKIHAMKVGELRQLAADMGIDNITNLRKTELRDVILSNIQE